MNNKVAIAFIAAVGAALAAGPVSAEPHHGSRGGPPAAAAGHAGGAHFGARAGNAGKRASGSAGMGQARAHFNTGARFSGNSTVGNSARFASSNNWRGRHWDGRRHYGYGPGFAAGVAIGSAPAWGGGYGYDDYAYSPGYSFDNGYAYDDGDAYADDGYAAAPAASSDSDDQYCMQRYHSYDPGSGTYLGYDGERHPCP